MYKIKINIISNEITINNYYKNGNITITNNSGYSLSQKLNIGTSITQSGQKIENYFIFNNTLYSIVYDYC